MCLKWNISSRCTSSKGRRCSSQHTGRAQRRSCCRRTWRCWTHLPGRCKSRTKWNSLAYKRKQFSFFLLKLNISGYRQRILWDPRIKYNSKCILYDCELWKQCILTTTCFFRTNLSSRSIWPGISFRLRTASGSKSVASTVAFKAITRARRRTPSGLEPRIQSLYLWNVSNNNSYHLLGKWVRKEASF